jgi:ATP-binding cassette subfamily B multidrug efflux pump
MLIRLIREHLRPYKKPILIVVGLQFIGTMVMLYLPILNADIIDNGVINGDTGYIVRHGGLMLAVSLLQIVCSVVAVWFSARTAMAFGRDVRAKLFHRVGSFSAREVQQLGAPSLITRETNDVQQVQMLVLLGGTLMVSAPIMMIGGVVMAIHVNAGLSWLVAAVVPTLAISIGFIVTRMVPSFAKMQERIDEVNRLLREQITGVRVVRAFVREPHETARFAEANEDLTQVSIRAGRWLAGMFPTVMLIANVASVGVLWFGGHRVESGSMQIGDLTAYLSYLMQIVMSVMMATFMMMMIPRSTVCAARITEVGCFIGNAGHCARRARHIALRERRVHLPGCGRTGRARHLLRCRSGADAGHYRLDRCRQVHDHQLGATTLRCHRRAGRRRRCRCPRPRARTALVQARTRAAARVPVQRDDRRQLAVRQG